MESLFEKILNENITDIEIINLIENKDEKYFTRSKRKKDESEFFPNKQNMINGQFTVTEFLIELSTKLSERAFYQFGARLIQIAIERFSIVAFNSGNLAGSFLKYLLDYELRLNNDRIRPKNKKFTQVFIIFFRELIIPKLSTLSLDFICYEAVKRIFGRELSEKFTKEYLLEELKDAKGWTSSYLFINSDNFFDQLINNFNLSCTFIDHLQSTGSDLTNPVSLFQTVSTYCFYPDKDKYKGDIAKIAFYLSALYQTRLQFVIARENLENDNAEAYWRIIWKATKQIREVLNDRTLINEGVIDRSLGIEIGRELMTPEPISKLVENLFIKCIPIDNILIFKTKFLHKSIESALINSDIESHFKNQLNISPCSHQDVLDITSIWQALQVIQFSDESPKDFIIKKVFEESTLVVSSLFTFELCIRVSAEADFLSPNIILSLKDLFSRDSFSKNQKLVALIILNLYSLICEYRPNIKEPTEGLNKEDLNFLAALVQLISSQKNNSILTQSKVLDKIMDLIKQEQEIRLKLRYSTIIGLARDLINVTRVQINAFINSTPNNARTSILIIKATNLFTKNSQAEDIEKQLTQFERRLEENSEINEDFIYTNCKAIRQMLVEFNQSLKKQADKYKLNITAIDEFILGIEELIKAPQQEQKHFMSYQ